MAKSIPFDKFFSADFLVFVKKEILKEANLAFNLSAADAVLVNDCIQQVCNILLSCIDSCKNLISTFQTVSTSTSSKAVDLGWWIDRIVKQRTLLHHTTEALLEYASPRYGSHATPDWLILIDASLGDNLSRPRDTTVTQDAYYRFRDMLNFLEVYVYSVCRVAICHYILSANVIMEHTLTSSVSHADKFERTHRTNLTLSTPALQEALATYTALFGGEHIRNLWTRHTHYTPPSVQYICYNMKATQPNIQHLVNTYERMASFITDMSRSWNIPEHCTSEMEQTIPLCAIYSRFERGVQE